MGFCPHLKKKNLTRCSCFEIIKHLLFLKLDFNKIKFGIKLDIFTIELYVNF